MQNYLQYILFVQVISCFFMTGAIWIIQIVHYPSFHFVQDPTFSRFHQYHSSQITWVVAPMMVLELVTGLGLAYFIHGIWIFQFALILFLWLVTFFVSVPIHNKLGQVRDEQVVKKLVRTNWIRTLLWTLRTLIILFTVSIGISL